MSGIDIDTRSDIYSLGVLLYELLTGRTPFDPEELMRKAQDEIRRVIREQDPQTPSVCVHTMAADLRTNIAQHRQSDPAKLSSLLRGDLDWIVMKALEKDRTRRYKTANGLAMDIQRHLVNEPVRARPPSHFYRLQRFVRRNRVVFAACVTVAATLVFGLSVAIHSFLNERTARAGETKQREIAEEYRKRLGDSRVPPPDAAMRLDESLAKLAEALHQQGRNAEAEPLCRKVLESRHQQTPRDNDAVLTAVSIFTSVLLSLEDSERTAGDTAKMANHARQADALISEQLALLAEPAVRNSKDTVFLLKVAALQAWFGRDADFVATCRRLIQQAEEKPEDAHIAERAALSWCLSPSSAPALLAPVLRIARNAAEHAENQWQHTIFQKTLGFVEYHADNEMAATQALLIADESAEQFPTWDRKHQPFIQGPARLYRAMILFHNGKEAEARKLFVEAEALMNPLPTDDRQAFQNGGNLEELLFWLAYKEAKALLQSQVPSAPSKPDAK